MIWYLDSNFICFRCRLRRLMQAGRTEDKNEPYIMVQCGGFDLPTYFFDEPDNCPEFVPKEGEQ